MEFLGVNMLPVLVAGIASMGLGMFWYSPLLFGKAWMKLSGLTEKKMEAAKKEMGKTYTLSFIATLVTGFVLSMMLTRTAVASYPEGKVLAFFLWLGFVAPVMMTEVLFGNKPWRLYGINVGYQLASILTMAAILMLWQ